ncbi:hypothetical protein [Shimazuella kribbensis]|uniref:hypothetical protein n=1 Tax=Shimazuella kribbensis TaxID=139808 RepID=UPI0012EB7C99|nr:hypothetical protein [Shimazuella kribbensis]
MKKQSEEERNLAQAQAIGQVLMYVIPLGILYFFIRNIDRSVLIWGLVTIVGTVVTLYIGIKLLILWFYRRRAEKDVRYIRVLPSAETTFNPTKIMQLVRTFGGMSRRGKEKWLKGQPWYRIRFDFPEESNEIGIYLGFPQDKTSGIQDIIRNIYPHCEIHPIPHDKFPQPCLEGIGGHFSFRRGRRKGLPMTSLKEQKESPLGDILACLRPGTMIDVQFSPEGWGMLDERSEEVLEGLKEKKVHDLTPDEKAKRTSLAKRLTGREEVFRVRMSLWSDNQYAVPTMRSTAVAIETALKHDGAVRFYRWRNPWYRHPLRDKNPIPVPFPTTKMIWTDDELANLFHLPPNNHPIYQKNNSTEKNERGYIPHLPTNHRTLDKRELNEGAFLGIQDHPLYQRDIRIDFEQLTKHFLVTGAPGMGKSSLIIDMMDSMIRDWIQDPNHPGITIIDPSQETIAVIQNRLAYMELKQGLKIPKDRIKYFDLTNKANQHPGLNILHVPKGVDIQTAADNAADVILYTANSDNLTEAKRILKNCIQALILDKEEHSILAIPEFLRNPAFRKTVIKRIKGKDPYVYREIRGWGDDPIDNDAILNRIDPLLRNITMRRMYGQKEWTFDISTYMNKGYLVFIDTLGLSQEGIKVTVGNLVNQYHMTAKSRTKGSKYHFMLIDESHLVQIPIIAKIIAEDRKFNFGIGLVTQMIDQITNKELLTALNLMGTIITCAQTGVGASKIETMTEHHFKRDFITQLHERYAAVFTRIKVDGESQVMSCMVRNNPPTVYLPSGREANYRNHEKGIAERYGLRWAKILMEDSSEVKRKEEIDKLLQSYLDYIDRIGEPGPQDPDDDDDRDDKPSKSARVIY